jgi:hypothetical protein
VKRWSDTHVGFSGGGGYVGPRGGVVQSPTITSRVVQRSQVFVLRQDGIEEPLELGDLMPLREGQTITAIYGGQQPESGNLLLLHNHESASTYAEPMKASSGGPTLWFFVLLFAVWGLAALFVEPLASALPVSNKPPISQYSFEAPLNSIFTERAEKRHAYCLATPRHFSPSCAGYEKPPPGAGASACACKSVTELLQDDRGELIRESRQGDAFAGALVIMLIVGGLGGLVIATSWYLIQMRSRRKALRFFLVEAAAEASQTPGVSVTAEESAYRLSFVAT